MTYSLDIRERAVSYVKNGGQCTEASHLFKVGRKTLYNWLRAKNLHPQTGITRRRKLDRQALKVHVRDNPDALLRERAEHFGVRVNAIWYALKQMKIVKKNDALHGKSLR